MNQIQGWTTVLESYSRAVEQGPLLSPAPPPTTDRPHHARVNLSLLPLWRHFPLDYVRFSVDLVSGGDDDKILLPSRSLSFPLPPSLPLRRHPHPPQRRPRPHSRCMSSHQPRHMGPPPRGKGHALLVQQDQMTFHAFFDIVFLCEHNFCVSVRCRWLASVLL